MKIASYLPETILDNAEFEKYGWSGEKIFGKTGIRKRHVAGKNEFSRDLAIKACENLFSQHNLDRGQIDYLIYCTQSPDTILPNNSSVLQEALGLSKNIGSFDYNQGCTGYLYGLSIAKGMLLTGQSKNLLLVTSETYTKHIDDEDRTNRTIFGDAATATFLTTSDAEKIGDFLFGTSGKGAGNLCVEGWGLRGVLEKKELGKLYMNGPAIFSFTIEVVPESIRRYFEKTGISLDDIDHVVFHQANGYILEHLRKKLKIPKEKFHLYLENVGNTVSSTIPIVLEELYSRNAIGENQKILLVAFGVGYSWAVTVFG